MKPDEFKLADIYRYEIAVRVGFWAKQDGIRLNRSASTMSKGMMASLVTQMGKEEDFWQLEGVHRADENVGLKQFRKVDNRSARITPIPPSIKAFMREGKKFDGLIVGRRRRKQKMEDDEQP